MSVGWGTAEKRIAHACDVVIIHNLILRARAYSVSGDDQYDHGLLERTWIILELNDETVYDRERRFSTALAAQTSKLPKMKENYEPRNGELSEHKIVYL